MDVLVKITGEEKVYKEKKTRNCQVSIFSLENYYIIGTGNDV